MTDLLLVFGQSLGVYLLIIFCLRLLGKKGLSELSVADLVLIIIIGESIGHLIPEETKFSGTIVYIITLVGANYLIETFSYKFKKFRIVLEGVPVILIRDGKIIHSNMKKEKVTTDNLEEAIRSKGVKGVEKVELGILETDGEISIIPIKDINGKVLPGNKKKAL